MVSKGCKLADRSQARSKLSVSKAVFEMIVEKQRSDGITMEQVRKKVHHDSRKARGDEEWSRIKERRQAMEAQNLQLRIRGLRSRFTPYAIGYSFNLFGKKIFAMEADMSSML